MKTEVVVNLPIDKVFELYLDKSRFKDWKRDFVSYEQISGKAGEVGCVTKLVYKKFVMVETITSKNAPDEVVATYEHKHGGNTMMFHTAKNRFTSLGGTRTLIEVDSEITKVNWFVFGLIMKLMAGAGRKHAQEQLDRFKVIAEKGT